MAQASEILSRPGGRCAVMGILNVTDDSFSDGGEFIDPGRAVEHAHELVDAGADIVDVGGESTRPGATRVAPEEERARVVPVIERLTTEGIATSGDTMRAETALAAADAGVRLINDVSGGSADEGMLGAMARTGLPVTLMHWRTDAFGDAAGRADHGGDVVADVRDTLKRLAGAALEAGVERANISLDPGLGFAKNAEDNWRLLRALPELVDLGYPLLVGASRKRFLSGVRQDRGIEAGPKDADAATAAVSALSARAGAWAVRVHDVASSRDAVDVELAWRRGAPAARG